jgi:hypothetical protein
MNDSPRSRQIALLLASFKFMLEEMTPTQLDELEDAVVNFDHENALVEVFALDNDESQDTIHP